MQVMINEILKFNGYIESLIAPFIDLSYSPLSIIFFLSIACYSSFIRYN